MGLIFFIHLLQLVPKDDISQGVHRKSAEHEASQTGTMV